VFHDILIKYEIERRIEDGKGLLEIDISKIKNKDGNVSRVAGDL
jgi:hypothetical protein